MDDCCSLTPLRNTCTSLESTAIVLRIASCTYAPTLKNGLSITVGVEPRNISELSHIVKDYNYGDLVAFSDYRDTGSYIIGKRGKLVSNEDNSGLGYLSIPYEITQYLDNAVEMYCHFGLSVNDIEIRYDDKYIKDNVNTEKCKILEEWNWEITWFPNSIHIMFPNGVNEFFNIKNTDTQQILDWYQAKLLSNH